MFEQKSLDRIDGDYFNIIIADSQDVTIQSRNTGHYWYLHCAGYPTEEALVIFHKHRFKDGYHQHGHARSLRQRLLSRHIARTMTGWGSFWRNAVRWIHLIRKNRVNCIRLTERIACRTANISVVPRISILRWTRLAITVFERIPECRSWD